MGIREAVGIVDGDIIEMGDILDFIANLLDLGVWLEQPAGFKPESLRLVCVALLSSRYRFHILITPPAISCA